MFFFFFVVVVVYVVVVALFCGRRSVRIIIIIDASQHENKRRLARGCFEKNDDDESFGRRRRGGGGGGGGKSEREQRRRRELRVRAGDVLGRLWCRTTTRTFFATLEEELFLCETAGKSPPRSLQLYEDMVRVGVFGRARDGDENKARGREEGGNGEDRKRTPIVVKAAADAITSI